MEYGACDVQFRNSNPISKNPKFWILEDVDRTFEITDYTFEMLKTLMSKAVNKIHRVACKGNTITTN